MTQKRKPKYKVGQVVYSTRGYFFKIGSVSPIPCYDDTENGSIVDFEYPEKLTLHRECWLRPLTREEAGR